MDTVEPGPIASQPALTLAASQAITPDNAGLGTQFSSPLTQLAPTEASATPTAFADETTQYDLDVIFDYRQHSLSVSEKIRYVNTSPEGLDELLLVVEANRIPGAFSMKLITWEPGEPIEDFNLEGDQIHIPLPQTLAPGEMINVYIRYELVIPKAPLPSETTRPLPFGYTERQVNIVDWYPYIPPYRPGDGWLAHKNWWFGEHQVFDRVDFHVKLTLAEQVEGLVIAASAPVMMQGEDTYLYHQESARSFALSASHEYIVQTTTVGDITVYSYSFPFHEYAGEEVLHNTADAMELFSQLILPYPHSSLSVVEADFLDGMEYDGLYFLSHGFYNLYEGTPRGYLTFISAHETAHQWWYGLVGNDQALEPWLDEAMCTYMEYLFYENVYAEYPSVSDQSITDWWWYYRVNFYNPSGWVNGSIYDYDQFRTYRDAVYLNGAKFLHGLRSRIGDEAFFSFLKDYATQKQNTVATALDFFAILQENTDEDVDGWIRDYFQAVK
jgi:hypothetical protein